MNIDELVREVMDMRRTLDEAVRDIERFMRIKSETVSYLPPAPFSPTIEDFNAMMNNDRDDDGA